MLGGCTAHAARRARTQTRRPSVAPAAGCSASAVRPELRGLTAPRSPRSSTSRWSRSTQGAPPAHRTRPLAARPTHRSHKPPSEAFTSLLLAPQASRLLGPDSTKGTTRLRPPRSFLRRRLLVFECEVVVTHRHRVRVQRQCVGACTVGREHTAPLT